MAIKRATGQAWGRIRDLVEPVDKVGRCSLLGLCYNLRDWNLGTW